MNININDLIVSRSLNAKVLQYLRRIKPKAPIVASWDSVPGANVNCGSHPDIVNWLWIGINSTLPEDCRFLIFGCPALVHPESGIIFAIAMGTNYGLRAPKILHPEAIAAGAKTIWILRPGNTIDIQMELGEEWLFGFGGRPEIALIGIAYTTYN